MVTITTPIATATVKQDGRYVGTVLYWILDNSIAYVIPGVTEEIRIAPNLAEANVSIQSEISNRHRSGFAQKGR